ncbi:MAG TPA: RNA-binding protein [Firmicutes bacterium]|nr:RNA-binding protein [Bacillota bacterium]HBK60018.1 RNA-binding protein [Bacillota bacterium]
MSSDGPSLGQLVVSKMGRDKGRLYVVVGLSESRYAYIADGVTHRMSSPKRKNRAHLIVLEQVDEGAKSRLASGLPLSDTQLVTALRAYRPHERKEEHAQ